MGKCKVCQKLGRLDENGVCKFCVEKERETEFGEVLDNLWRSWDKSKNPKDDDNGSHR